MKIATVADAAGNGPQASGDLALNRSTTPSYDTDASWQTEVEISRGREVDGVTIVDVAGRATLGKGYGQLPKTVKNIVGSGQRKILLDLGGVRFIDSYGLNDLVSSYTNAASRGAELKLVNVPERVRYLLQLTKLDSVFESFGEERAAVLSFSA